MPDNPYQKFDPDDLILRDELAIDRTILANERTALAYTRMALTLVIAGVSFLQFAPARSLLFYSGLVFLPLGVLTGVYGLLHFRKVRRHIMSVRRTASPADAKANEGNPTKGIRHDRQS